MFSKCMFSKCTDVCVYVLGKKRAAAKRVHVHVLVHVLVHV